MDAFVIRTKRENKNKADNKKKKKSLKQITIEALPVSLIIIFYFFHKMSQHPTNLIICLRVAWCCHWVLNLQKTQPVNV